MISGKKVIVVLPAYRAELTLERTLAELAPEVADEIILVDDFSHDATVEIARHLNLRVFVHDRNRGYGANQKTCYTEALKLGADIILMLHPDYQYSPKLAGAMAQMIASGEYDVVLGSRILAQNAVRAGMPRHKYLANRFLTMVQNLMVDQKLSEYHTGYRAFARAVLTEIPWQQNSDNFLFDNEILCQIIRRGFRIGEISCPTRYNPDASSIGLRQSVIYGLGVLGCCIRFSRWSSREAG
jgi:glycosyltransferase involved in cell wall biosynthesis